MDLSLGFVLESVLKHVWRDNAWWIAIAALVAAVVAAGCVLWGLYIDHLSRTTTLYLRLCGLHVALPIHCTVDLALHNPRGRWTLRDLERHLRGLAFPLPRGGALQIDARDTIEFRSFPGHRKLTSFSELVWSGSSAQVDVIIED